jgi:NitT/TauT family transport system permease protein
LAGKKPQRNTWAFGFFGLAVLLGLWQWAHLSYGSFILPGLDETAIALLRMIEKGIVGPALALTAANAATGWLIGMLAGTLAGTLAGLRDEIRFTLQPVAMILLGVPAIAWIVLALLWFGGRWAVIFTIAVATAPIVYTAAAQGVGSLDGALARMARTFRTPFSAMAFDVYGPHMLGYLFPALATTLAMSWKVSVMAELLSGSGGIGDGIATARVRMDSAETMAWIVVVVCVLIVFDHLILQPLQRRMEFWRDTARRRSS